MATLVVVLLALSFAPATASAADGGQYIVTLGDSSAAGTQQPLPFTNRSYTDLLFNNLERRGMVDGHVKLGCPGEDTVKFLDGSAGSACYAGGPLSGFSPNFAFDSQIEAAEDFLISHPGEVAVITIGIGANDLLACDPTDPGVDACVAGQLGQIAVHLPTILTRLATAAPGVPIVGMNYYNSFLAFWVTGNAGKALAAATNNLFLVFNDTLEAIYGGAGVPVADVERAYKSFNWSGNKYPTNVRFICRLTLMCERAGPILVLSDYDPLTPGPRPTSTRRMPAMPA